MGTTIVPRSFSEVEPDHHTWVLQSYRKYYRKSSKTTIHGCYNRTAIVLGGRATPPYMVTIIVPQSFSEVAPDHHTWVLQSYRDRSLRSSQTTIHGPYNRTTIVSEVELDHHTWVLQSYRDRSRRSRQTTIHGYYNRTTIVIGSRARPPYMGTTIVPRSFSEVEVPSILAEAVPSILAEAVPSILAEAVPSILDERPLRFLQRRSLRLLQRRSL